MRPRRRVLDRLIGAIVGVLASAALLAAVAVACVYGGFAPIAADNKPLPFEASLGMRALHATSEREMGAVPNPLPVTEANLAAGLRVYRRECMICHGSADGRASDLARGLYIPPPQFAVDGSEDDPEGATFWKVRHGVRFTAMPAYEKTLSDSESWQVTMFVKRMDRLPASVEALWRTSSPSAGGGASSRAEPAMTMP